MKDLGNIELTANKMTFSLQGQDLRVNLFLQKGMILFMEHLEVMQQ